MKRDVYQVITERILVLLEVGTVPWRRPWKGRDQAPQNFVSRKAYRGINVFILNAAEYLSPFWLTFRQIQALGARVKKGEKSSPVVFWKMFETEENGETKRIPFLRYHTVFNVTQCEGIMVPPATGIPVAFSPIEVCEGVVANMPSPPEIEHGRDRACYYPLRDTVVMPDPSTFETPAAHYSTLFHELTHATGHASRLNRRGVTTRSQFGSETYSREELVAEMGAAFLCGHCGIENTQIDQSASYIQGWLIRLRDDRRLMVQAAAQAQKACDFILGATPNDDEPGESAPKECKVAALRECPTPQDMQMRDTLSEPQITGRCISPVRPISTLSMPENESLRRADPPVRKLKIEADGDFWRRLTKPKIRLMGHWLRRAGFSPGSHVHVACVAPGVIELRSTNASKMNETKEA